MSESAPAPETAKTPVPEHQTFADVLKGMLGKMVMFVNAESFEEGGLGYTLEAGWYRGKLTAIGQDYLTVISEFKHGVGKKATKEPIKQYIPRDKIKRITVMKTQVLVHI
jgi:hypothetical protein